MTSIKRMKRFVSMLLCVIMLTGNVLPAFADGGHGGHDHGGGTETHERGEGDRVDEQEREERERLRKEEEVKREAVVKETGTSAGTDGTTPKKAPQKVAKKVGPNDPCPCGSGKKYKKCCGAPGKNNE